MSPSTAKTNVLCFGDQTAELGSSLHNLYRKAKTSANLEKFLSSTVTALRSEISRLPSEDKALIPDFRSFSDVAERCNYTPKNAVLCTLSLCIAQLGDFIFRAERDSKLLGSSLDDGTKRRVLGLCTGLLPAAAAAVSTNICDLNEIAKEIVLISLRLALRAINRSAFIERDSGSWSTAIHGPNGEDARNAIRNFNCDKLTPTHKYVYVSSTSRSGVTISGPPSSLNDFISSNNFSGARHTRLPIFAAFHASHLAAPQMNTIIGSSPLLCNRLTVGTTLISPRTGLPYAGETLHDLLTQVVQHIFQEEMFPAKAFDYAFHDLQPAQVTLYVFGPSSVDGFLRQYLKNHDSIDPKGPLFEGTLDPDVSDSIAVVGMSGRFPGGESLETFWQTLEKKKDLHTMVPENRWKIQHHLDPTGKTPNSTLSAFGCFLASPGDFDNTLFGMSPREAQRTDPIQRLLLMVAYEALEMAGYQPHSAPTGHRIGTYIGLAQDDWREYNLSQDIDMYFVPGSLRAFSSGRLNHFFKFNGPSFTVDTACSSSGATIELACRSLLDRTCDMAVAGGANVMTGPNTWAGLSRAGFVSPTGGCKTFDETADGYCRGDGVGIVVLKRLSDAVADGDNIQGVIKGIATNHSTKSASIVQPDSSAQVNLYREVLRQANVRPDQVRYVEMHGTGTQTGDIVEMNSVMDVFGPRRLPANPLYVGSVKPNVGHGEAAAGVTSLIKTLMMFRQNSIPPHAGIKTRVNPKLPPLQQANFRIAQQPEPFFKTSEPRRVFVNSFGAAGGNTSMLVEEPPRRRPGKTDPRSHHIVVFSAKEKASLERNQQKMIDFIDASPTVRLEDIAYTTTTRRQHHPLRSAFCVSSTQSLRDALISHASLHSDCASSKSKRQNDIIFLFTGQGSKTSGLARTLYRTCETFRQSLLAIEGLCKALHQQTVIDVILALEGEDIYTQNPIKSHLALVALEISMAHTLKSWGLSPRAVVGHSLGEFAALCVADVLTVADTLLLVGKRAELIHDLCEENTHGMLAVQESADRFNDVVKYACNCEISCINGPNNIVISGRAESLQNLRTELEKQGIASSYVRVPYAFHSAHIEPILAKYQEVTASVTFSKPMFPIASSLLGKVVTDDSIFSSHYLLDQTRKPVLFEDAIRALQSSRLLDEDTLLIETGPGVMCLNMAQSILGNTNRLLPCLHPTQSNWLTLSKVVSEAYVAGNPINWIEYHKDYRTELIPVDLPSYQFNLRNFWMPFEGGVAAYRDEVANLREQLSALQTKLQSAAEPDAQVTPHITTCTQKVLVEEISGDFAKVEFLTDVQEPSLRNLIDGHSVTGIPLAPHSLYVEIALSAVRYVVRRIRPEQQIINMDLSELDISAPLFLQQNSIKPQMIKITATAESKSTSIQVLIASDKTHARCVVNLTADDWARNWTRRRYMIDERVSHLRLSTPERPVHHMLGDMVYKIFSPITKYSGEYRSISEIHMDPSFSEAAAILKTRQTPSGSNFSVDPCWIDGMAQVAGFLLNTNTSNAEDCIMMSTGCDLLRLNNSLIGGKQYTCHVKSETLEGGASSLCDVMVFDDNSLVAIGEGFRFKRVKKALLQRMLTLANAQTSQTSPHTITGLDSKPACREYQTSAPSNIRTTTRLGPPSQAIKRELCNASNDDPKSYSSAKPMKSEASSNILGGSNSCTELTIAKKSLQVAKQSQMAALLDIVFQETGVEHLSTEDDMTLEQLGVDSLLTVTITSRLKAEHDIEIPASLLAGDTTISELRSNMSQTSTADVSADGRNDDSTATDRHSGTDCSSTAPTSLAGVSEPEDGDEPLSPNHVIEALREAISQETGLAHQDISEESSFEEMGIDSLLSVSVIGITKDRCGFELPANIFAEYDSLAGVRKGLARNSQINGASSAKNLVAPTPTPQAQQTKVFRSADYHSKVVLLQGKSQSTDPCLFLVTDGGGSAAVYVYLPTLAPNLRVYALESPFLEGREEDLFLEDATMEKIASIFGRAVRSVQPQGPYLIGGYSVGGMLAYETMRYLIQTGDRVHGLMLFDAACPINFAALPDVTVDVCEMMGLYDRTSEESRRRPLTYAQKLHVAGLTRAVARAKPIPIEERNRPKHASVIWARTGLLEHMMEKMVEVDEMVCRSKGIPKSLGREQIEWLNSNKSSPGPRGWDKLLGTVETFVIEGDHWSIVTRPLIKTVLGTLAQKLVGQMLESLNNSALASSLSANDLHQKHIQNPIADADV